MTKRRKSDTANTRITAIPPLWMLLYTHSNMTSPAGKTVAWSSPETNWPGLQLRPRHHQQDVLKP